MRIYKKDTTNIARITREINEAREKKGKNTINYITVTNYLKAGKSPKDIINMNIQRGGARIKQELILSNKDFERARLLYKNGLNLRKISQHFDVSISYFYNHKDKITNG